MRERILKFIEFKNMTSAEFADKIGVQRSNVSHVLNGRNNPSYMFIEKIIRAFDDIDAKWLLTGIGNMVTKSNSETLNGRQELKLPLNMDESKKEQNSAPVNEIKEENTEEYNVKSTFVNAKNDKNITRIVIFYNDHTFIDYSPSK